MSNFNATADSNRAQLRYIAETSVGVTPATPTLTNLRMTGESVNPARTTVASTEIRSDRQVPDLITTGESASGTVNFELSYGEYDAIFANALQGTWTSGLLVNGTTRSSFTFEKGFDDVGLDYQFLGSEVTKLSFDFKTGATVTGSFDLMSRSFTSSTGTIGAAPATPSQTYSVYNTVSDIQSLSINGTPVLGIQELKLDINNNAREQRQIGTKALAGIGFGQIAVTGTFTAYLGQATAINAAYDSDSHIALTWTVGSTNQYVFTLPSVKLSSRTVNAGAINQDVVMTFNFQAVLDPVSGHTITIHR